MSARHVSAAALLAWALVLPSRGAWAEDPLSIDDFGYSMELASAPSRAVQTAIVPLPVYRHVTRDDLGDMRVFNAEGVEVPHAVRTLDGTRLVEPSRVSLPLFPLVESKARLPSGDLALEVERSADGRVLNVRTRVSDTTPPTSGDPRVVGYVLDASALDAPISSLDVHFANVEGDYVLHVRVDRSDDLSGWTRVTSHETIIRLNYEGNQLEDHRIDLSSTDAKYLRLSWNRDELPSPIAEVTAELRAERLPGPRLSFRTQATKGDEAGVYVFDLGGPVPVDRVRVLLPSDNTLIKAELGSSRPKSGKPHRATSGRFYRITENGDELTSPAIDIARRTDRYWFLTLSDHGGALGDGLPELEVEYFPDQLLFVAQGGRPHQLAYGSHGVKPAGFSASDLLALANEATSDLPRASASLAPEQIRAGTLALTQPTPPPPIKKYLLWAILIAGVLILGVMVLRLQKSLR